jgi:hypothetical protein
MAKEEYCSLTHLTSPNEDLIFEKRGRLGNGLIHKRKEKRNPMTMIT